MDGSDEPNEPEEPDGQEGSDGSEEPEEPIVLESAHRHGVAEEDMLHALRFAIRQVRQDDGMVMFIGPDRTGILCEVGAVIWWGGEFAIVHAMRPARSKYLK